MGPERRRWSQTRKSHVSECRGRSTSVVSQRSSSSSKCPASPRTQQRRRSMRHTGWRQAANARFPCSCAALDVATPVTARAIRLIRARWRLWTDHAANTLLKRSGGCACECVLVSTVNRPATPVHKKFSVNRISMKYGRATGEAGCVIGGGANFNHKILRVHQTFLNCAWQRTITQVRERKRHRACVCRAPSCSGNR